MRIGKQDQNFTAICTSDAESITVRGHDLVNDLMGQVDFSSYFWLLVTGQMPNEEQQFFLNAVLVALAEHGLGPSVVAARMTLAAAPEAVQGAVAAGLLGCGSVVLGSAEIAGRFYAGAVADRRESGDSIEDVAKRQIRQWREHSKAVPGFGHPQHAGGDPRANRLLERRHNARLEGRAARYDRPRPADQRQRRDPFDHARPRLAAPGAEGHRAAVPHGGADRPPDRGGRAADRVYSERSGGEGNRV